MKKKILFITGCEGQIGQATVNYFSERAWDCYGMDKVNKTKLNSLKFYQKGDVSERISFKDLFSAIKLESNIEYQISLLNNAGVAVFTSSEERTYEEYKYVSDVNLLGPIFGITEFFKHFSSQKNEFNLSRLRILNISSIYGLISPNQKIYTDTSRNSSEIYGATKAGLIQLTKYFASRYADSNLQVNCIAPGGILNKEVQGPEFIKNYSNLVPLNRLCNVEELVNLIYSILNTDCSYLTGQTISLDGGMTTW